MDNFERVTAYKKAKEYENALALLFAMMDEEEKEAARQGWGVAPWSYDQAVTIYRKLKMPDKERAVLKRFAEQPHGRGVKTEKLLERWREIQG